MNNILLILIVGLLTSCAHDNPAKESSPTFTPPVMPGFKMEKTDQVRDGCPMYKLTSSYGVEYLVTCSNVDLPK